MKAGPRPRPALAAMLREQVRVEILKIWRQPVFSLFGLALPLLLFVFFGLPNAATSIGGVHGGTFLMASFGAYAVGNIMLSTFGITIASERARFQDVLMRATPAPGWVVVVGRLASAMAFGLVALILLAILASAAAGVRMSVFHWADLGWKLLAGSLPLLMLGFAIGYSVSPNAAAAVVNLIALPLYFASGLFTPLEYLPQFIQKIAPYLPTYLFGQLAWNSIGAPSDPLARDLAGLAVYGVAFVAAALLAYRWQLNSRFS